METKDSLSLVNTALSETHRALGAKMVGFAGFNMPVQYEGINAEHENVRKNVGVFDVSHMGEFIVRGKGSLELLQRITSNDVSKLSKGKAQYSCFTNNEGGIIDDLIVYCLGEESYMLVVNASNISKDWNWITMHNSFGAETINISDKTSLLAVQGPQAQATLQKLTQVDLAGIPYYNFEKGTFCGIENVLISNTGYTGAGGFELYFEKEHSEKIWKELFEAGKEYNIKPIGLGARDTLRLEMGFCLYGNDIDDTTSPLEAGLGWITKFTKDFTASELLKQQKASGLTRKLVGFVMQEKGIPRHGYEVQDENGSKIGIVRSGTMSPSLQVPIGMAYIQTALASPGSIVYIKIRENNLKAEVVKTPFISK